MQQSFSQVIASVNTAGTLYNTYTTAKSMLTSATSTGASAGFIKIPANFFQIGTQLEIDIFAGISNRVTGPDTFAIQMMVGAVIAFTTGNINLTTTAHTTFPAWFKIWLTCRSIGNGTLATLIGSCQGEGQMLAMISGAADNAAGTGNVIAPNSAPAVGTGFDSTIDNTLDLFVAQSVSNAGNGFQLQKYSVKSTNVSSY